MNYSRKRKLKNYLIAPKQQFMFGFFILTSICLAGGTQALFLVQKIRILRETGELFEPEIDAKLVSYILQSFGITMLILGAFIFILNIFFTHRIFGSLHVIQKYFQNAIEGKIDGPIPSRKDDMTQSLVETINLYFKQIKQDKNER